MLVYEEQFGVDLEDFDGVQWRPDDARPSRGQCSSMIVEQAAAHWRALEPGEQRLGDVVVVNYAGWPCHLGLFMPPGFILHAEQGLDSVIETLAAGRWISPARIRGVYRHGP